MKSPLLTTLALLTVFAHATIAEARDKVAKPTAAAAPDSDADDGARVSTTEYIFDNDDVKGLVLRPEGVPVPAAARARFPSLLSIRGHFLPELVRMAKDV